MIYITGDTHGDFSRIEKFCKKRKTSRDDILIILGDAGINFSGWNKDIFKKAQIKKLPITLFCIHGNHEMRPESIPSYVCTNWNGGKVWVENAYENIIFAKDGEIYDIGGYKCIAMGGAYSVDKDLRMLIGEPWFEDEQPSDKIKEFTEKMLAQHEWKVDVVLSHTVPFDYMPTDMFIDYVDQENVDYSTEKWLGDIEKELDYKWWYAGHYHINRTNGKLQILFEDIEEFLPGREKKKVRYNKSQVNMLDWELSFSGGRYHLSGTAESHPRLGRNCYISYTTAMQDYSLENDVLTYETKNTLYICPLKYMSVENNNPYRIIIKERLREEIAELEKSDIILDKIIAAENRLLLGETDGDEFAEYLKTIHENSKDKIEENNRIEAEHLCSQVEKYEDSLYLEVTNVQSGDKIAYHFGDFIGTLEPKFHCGTFQNSVLYMKYGMKEAEGDECSFDFRYWPEGFGDGIKTYHWSDNIKQVVIKNNRTDVIFFNKETVEPGEIKCFTPESGSEGLISPDCYNGKSILTSSFSDSLHENDMD